MSSGRVVIEIKITVDCDGTPCVTVTSPTGATGPAPSSGSGATAPPAGGTGTSGTSGAAPSAPAATCAAQRTVHIVAGNGGLAWFTLVWPAPDVITGYIPNFSYDNPATGAPVPATGADHPLFVRKIGSRFVWSGIGKHDLPTVFVAGVNQTHTSKPDLTRIAGGGPEVIAAGATVQAALAAPMPVIAIGENLPFGPAPGAPLPAVVANVEAAIAAIATTPPLTPAEQQDLRPDPAKLAAWGITAATPTALVTLAKNLLFAANAFRRGLVATVLMPAFNDDPHGAFAGGDALAAARADALARVLDGFYEELALHPEPKSSGGATPLSLADNVVLVVTGDTPKTPFNRNGWGDGTPGGANLVYARANGYLKSGWFGHIGPNGRTNFDPLTGLLAPAATVAASTTAMQLAILFAIARGDVVPVAAASAAPFAGVIAPALP